MKIRKISLKGTQDTKEAKEFRTNAKNKFDAKFKDSSKNTGFEQELDSVKILGNGAYFLVENLGAEFINELMTEKLTSPFLIGEYGATVQDVFDNIPQYSKIIVEGDFEGYDATGRFKVSILKVSRETHDELAEAHLTIMDYEEAYSFM